MDHLIESVHRVRECLKAYGYSYAQVLPSVVKPWAFPLEPAHLWNFFFTRQNKLFHWTCCPRLYQLLFQLSNSSILRLFELFFLNQPAILEKIQEFFTDSDIALFLDTGILKPFGEYYVFNCRMVPFQDRILLSDRSDRSLPDFTYLGRDSVLFSTHLSEILRRTNRRFDCALDVATGTGIQLIHIARFVESGLGTDINDKALIYAKVNARLEGLHNLSFAHSRVFDNVSGSFDLIISNPPYVFFPKEARDEFRDGYGGEFGLEIVTEILEGIDSHLTEKGMAVIISESPVVGGTDLLQQTILRIFQGKPYQISLIPLGFFANRAYFFFQRRHGITHTNFYIAILEKGRHFQITIKELDFLRKSACLGFLAMTYVAQYAEKLFTASN
jgi:SAM-dependent methyltransferase